MLWWVVLLINVATMALSGLLQKAPKVKASALGDLQVPTAEEGRNLPVFWGTCCMRSPNVVWYGDYKVKAIKKSMGWMAFGRTYTAGHKYYLGMDLALCLGQVDALVDILAGTGEDLKHIAFAQTGPSQDGSRSLIIADSNCFGGEDAEGGISGTGRIYFGGPLQDSDAYMSGKLGIAYPAYRGVAHVVLNQLYMGTSQYIKNLAFVLRRCPSKLGLTLAQTNIAGDANPAEIIYDCLQGDWGLGFPAARFDVASFAAAGVTLASEGFGMSLLMDSPKQAADVIETVLQHIDGVCYTDPSTGLWTLKLIRPDYDPESIPEYDDDVIAECEFSRGSWEDTLNEVKVTFTDRAKWKQSVVQAQEPANFAIRGGELGTTTIDFSGFSSAAIAQKACNRELRSGSYPFGKGRVKINRSAWALRMGSPFRLTWPPLGISGMCVRVTGIDYGNLTDGMIEAEICEDIFSASYTAFSAPSGSGWTDPIDVDPEPAAAQMAIEAPHQLLDGAAAPRILTAAARGDGISLGYLVMTDAGAGYSQTNDVDYFTPGGQLAAAYSRKTAALDNAGFVISGVDLDDLIGTDSAGRDRGDNLLVFADNGEICAWQTVTANEDGSYTISGIVRGIFDTIPQDHAAGGWVLFLCAAGRDAMGDYDSELLADTGEDSIILND